MLFHLDIYWIVILRHIVWCFYKAVTQRYHSLSTNLGQGAFERFFNLRFSWINKENNKLETQKNETGDTSAMSATPSVFNSIPFYGYKALQELKRIEMIINVKPIFYWTLSLSLFPCGYQVNPHKIPNLWLRNPDHYGWVTNTESVWTCGTLRCSLAAPLHLI